MVVCIGLNTLLVIGNLSKTTCVSSNETILVLMKNIIFKTVNHEMNSNFHNLMFEGKSLIFQSAFQSFMRYLSINLFAYSYKKCVCIRNTKENILFDCKLLFLSLSRIFHSHGDVTFAV